MAADDSNPTEKKYIIRTYKEYTGERNNFEMRRKHEEKHHSYMQMSGTNSVPAENLYIVTLKPNEGHLISEIVNDFSGERGIQNEKIFVSWDFDDTLATHVKSLDFLPLVAYKGNFDAVSYRIFRVLVQKIFTLANEIDAKFPSLIDKSQWPKWFKEFKEAREHGDYDSLSHESKNSFSDQLIDAIYVLSQSNKVYTETLSFDKKKNAFYLPRNVDAVRKVFSDFIKKGIHMGIITNATTDHEDLKQDMLKNYFSNINLEFTYTQKSAENPHAEGKAYPLYSLLKKHCPSKVEGFYGGGWIASNRLAVHIDDKQIDGIMLLNGGNGPIPEVPTNTSILYINWKRPENISEQPFNTEMMEQVYGVYQGFLSSAEKDFEKKKEKK